jgi:proliferating cell nuclear antigen PCNA
MDSDIAPSKYLVEIETGQPGNLKALFGVLKEQITEANLDITPEYIEILQMDPTHIVVAHVRLQASNFEKYYCKNPIKIGIDVVNMTKVLKGVGSEDILTLFVEDPNEKTLNQTMGDDNEVTHPFGLLIETPKKGQTVKLYLDTLDVNEDELVVPDLDYPYHIYMPSVHLQSIVNNLRILGGDIIRLLYVKESLSFYTKGEIGRAETIRAQTNKPEDSLKIQKNIKDENDCGIIEIFVKLQKLVEFTKCSSLSPIATIYLKNDFPLFLEYDVGSLGFIRLGVSPHAKPDTY